MIGFLLGLMLLGLIAGAIARLLVPGRDPMGILGTMALGIVGSFVGGFLGALLFDGELALSTTSLLGSIIGAVIALLIYRQMNARTV
ncbi:MAG: GlsB/YeaQ/YmgE family stress response membrane protein [Actinomycetes bacterium]